jgi:hypothetical protein
MQNFHEKLMASAGDSITSFVSKDEEWNTMVIEIEDKKISLSKKNAKKLYKILKDIFEEN